MAAPPVRMRTKFLPPTTYDSSDYAQVYKPKNKTAPPTKAMGNLSLTTPKPKSSGASTLKNLCTGRKKELVKGKPRAPPVPKRESSKSMTNLAEPVYIRCEGSEPCSFRSYSVSMQSGSMSCLSSKGPRFSLGPRRPQCCLHSSCSNLSSGPSSRSDSNWSLQSLGSLNSLGPARAPLPR